MRKIIRIIQKYKRLEVEGYNQSYLLTKLAEAGVTVEKVEKVSPKLMFFNVKEKHSEKTFAIFENLCYNYKVVESHGIKEMLKPIVARIGLVIGLTVFALCAVFVENFVWKIKITGNDKIDTLAIERVLKENGISIGTKKHSIDAFKVRMLLNSLDGISESSVELVGTSLQITVFENTDYTDPVTPPEFSLVSKYDARISRIIVEDGTAKVALGDNIAKGTELISGEIFDSNGESMGLGAAKGQVYGIVNFAASMIFSDSEMTISDTGNKKVISSIEIFGIKLGGKKTSGFETFRKETKETYLSKNLLFPIKYTRSVYYETKQEIIENNVDDEIEKWKNEKILEMIISCGGSEIETIVVSNRIGGNLTKVDLFLQAEMPLI